MPVPALPLVERDPLHPPEAVHAVALLVVQLNVELVPVTMTAGLTVRFTVGAGVVTVTVTFALAEEPGPVQSRTKSVSASSALIVTVPLGGCVPLQPPEAVQDVALAACHVSVALSPLASIPGDALRDTVTVDALEAGADLLPPEQAASRPLSAISNEIDFNDIRATR